ncbi:polyhydroxyalkanoic acid system family protein [Paludisphaera rhizosphaerae]|uniref:polyhydroxyalkanoic acid system family protein n=1 Tax=Paludisphaera rhizosphaerae TaxID=2711216 RepID=UPI0013EADD46|nr:polyhydroxyalkanoic acid system family protein [Paludisphaera rhizosphaerae]
MAQLNMSFEHGQPWDAARANFESSIERARQEHGRWIHSVTWSEDRTSARLAGPSYEVVLNLDPTHVRAQGKIPLALKLLEPAVRRFVERTLRDQRPESA